MTPSTDQLIDLALKITGHPVRWHTSGPKGAWDGRRIALRYGMSDIQTRCTVAHELAHAVHGDPPGHVPGRELRADRAAAHLLIIPGAYAQAETMFGPDIFRIAAELGVTVHLATIWRTTQHRRIP